MAEAALSFGQMLAQAKRLQREALKQNPVWQTDQDTAKADRAAAQKAEREKKKKEQEAEAERKLAIKRAKDKIAAGRRQNVYEFDGAQPVNSGHAKKRPDGAKFKTRVINLAECTPVRIDEKTVIYVRPGRDPQEAIDAIKNRPEAQRKDKII